MPPPLQNDPSRRGGRSWLASAPWWLAFGVILLVIGVIVAAGFFVIRGTSEDADLGATFMCLVVGLVIMIAGIWIALQLKREARENARAARDAERNRQSTEKLLRAFREDDAP